MIGVRRFAWALVVLAALGLAAEAAACPVCYGDSDEPMIKAGQQAAVFMVGVTYLLLTGGVAAFITLRRRTLRRGTAAAPVKPDAAGRTADPDAAESSASAEEGAS
ncbi:MAG: hypothetical protein D6696_01805 [Acidobacteria bacterium]|nr:MAG: hypothetical protein D6696_01805 [Acidobacteriota bacterium]